MSEGGRGRGSGGRGVGSRGRGGHGSPHYDQQRSGQGNQGGNYSGGSGYRGRGGQGEGQAPRGRGGFQQSSSPGQRFGSGSGSGFRQAGGPAGTVEWRNRISYNSKPIDVKTVWKHAGQLPDVTDAQGWKKIMPKSKGPGQLKQRDVNVLTNHFQMTVRPPKQLFRYQVEMKKFGYKETEDGQKTLLKEYAVKRDMAKKIMMKVVPELKLEWEMSRLNVSNAQGSKSKRGQQKGEEICLIHDFAKIIFSTRKLEPIVELIREDIIHSTLPDEDDMNFIYKVTISSAAFSVDLDHLRKVWEEKGPMDINHPDLVELKQVYNILLKNLGSEANYIVSGRALLKRPLGDFNDANLEWGLMNWKGISPVINFTPWKQFINIDIQNSAHWIGQEVIRTIESILGATRVTATDTRTWKPWNFVDVDTVLKSCKVRRIINGKKMDGVISEVIRNKNATTCCFEKDGRNISVLQYYRNLGICLKHPNGPVLRIGKSAQVPAELCTIKDGQSFNRLLPASSTKQMIRQANQKPNKRYDSIMAGVDNLDMRENKLFESFGISATCNMQEFPKVRILPSPILGYGRSMAGTNADASKMGCITPDNGVWDVGSHSVAFFEPISIANWVVIFFVDKWSKPDNEMKQSVDQFSGLLIEEGKKRGMTIPMHDQLIKVNAKPDHWDHAENFNLISKHLENINKSFSKMPVCSLPSFVLCVVPDKTGPIYSQIKQAAEANKSTWALTQCIKVKNFDERKSSVISNLLLKINPKLGGKNYVPIFPTPSLQNINILNIPTLILGIDVNHPSLPIKGKPEGHPSFAAITGSIDRSGMPYMMHIQAQMRTGNHAIGAAEVIQNLTPVVKKMLITFWKQTKAIPQRIILYRDGVGESQFPEILHTEMVAIREACKQMPNEYTPGITIITVQKRHKTRIFLKEGGKVSTENVPAGTVVDTEIVSDSDFYLVSHKGAMGCSKPTHYHVLWDDNDFSADELQGLTYYLCYMYSRCNKAVSYPAPTYYAHLAALRARSLAEGTAWEGATTLDVLKLKLERNTDFETKFPMHFI